MSALASLRLGRLRLRVRRPRWLTTRRALLVLVLLAAVVVTVGPSRSASPGPASVSSATAYVAGQHRGLHIPAMAAVAVSGGQTSVRSVGAGADQPFVIGSVSKSFTAMATMQLIESGKVQLDEPVVTYLPGFRTRNRSASDRITVRQLLSHTSGLTTEEGLIGFRHPPTTLEREVSDLASVTAEPPGTFRYSNANFEVLGELVATVSGTSYADYVQRHVFAPLGMTHSFTDLAAARAAGLREGHRIWFGFPVPDGIYYRADYVPAGFLVSTAGDLGHYVTALLDGGRYRGTSVLGPRYVAQLLAPSTDASALGQHKSYGFGWYQETIGAEPVVTHPGSAVNTRADVVLVPRRHAGAAVLGNAESVVYEVFPRLDVVTSNAAMTAAGLPRQGNLSGLYEVFDLLALVILGLLVRVLLGAWRSRGSGLRGMSWPRLLFTLWRELLVPFVLLLEVPHRLGGGPAVLLRSDVGVVVLCWVILALGAFVLRFTPRRQGTEAAVAPAVRPRRLVRGLG
jgi:CubicO group peptidase (beta-lactamase class C family)